MQGSPSGKLEVAFVVISSTQKVVANMQVDRKYNACKALDPQIDNEDDVHHSSPNYEINEQELQTQMWLGGLHGCNEWTGRTGADWGGRGRLADGADGAEGGVLDQAWRGVKGGLGSLGRACQWTGRTGWDVHVQVDCPLRVLGPRGF